MLRGSVSPAAPVGWRGPDGRPKRKSPAVRGAFCVFGFQAAALPVLFSKRAAAASALLTL